MSSKNTSESMIAERRLRPIYDLLDYNNNKKAIQEADRVLKKSPDLDCAKVLKSLALLRLGRDYEAEQLLDIVAKRAPCDDATLQAMTICYRELRAPEKICNIYEEAVKKESTNEELLTHLFMSYVRVYNYKKQQHTAMSLYKLKSKNPYYFWAVMSIVMQASNTEGDISKSITLPLAERMVKKVIDENRIDAEQEIQLYIIILEMQHKYQQILDLLASPIGTMLQSYYTALQKKTEVLVAMKQWDQVNLVLKQQLLESDSWQNYVTYLQSVFHLVRQSSTASASVGDKSDDDVTTRVDSGFESCVEFLRRLEAHKASQAHKSRGVHLVKLEFYVLLEDYEKETGTLNPADTPLADRLLGASLVDLLLTYYGIFGHAPCCLKDLKRYLSYLGPAQVKVFSEALWRVNGIQGEEDYEPGDTQSMLRFISCLQFNRYLGKYNNYGMSVDSKLSLILRLTRTYYLCDAFTRDQAPAEIKHNDAFILLIIHLLHDLYVTDERYIQYILLYIHYVSSRNHYNFNLELLALSYYHAIGASGAAHMCYENLDMKHIQLDSLGYLHLGPLLSSAQFTLATKVFDSTLKFFTINYKDNADHLVLSYKFGSFLKISEFHRFRSRLNNSLHYTLSTIEKMLLELLHLSSYGEVLAAVQSMGIEPGTDNILWTQLEDNRDLSVFNSCNPSHLKPDAKLQSLTFSHDVTHLRLRTLLLRTLVASLHLAHPPPPPPPGGGEDRVQVLRRLVEEMEAVMEELKANPPVPVSKEVQGGPPPSRLFLYLSRSPLPHFLALARAVLALASPAEGRGFEAHMVTAVILLKRDLEAVQARFQEVQTGGRWETHRALIQSLNLLVEMIAITNIKCGVMHSLLKQRKAGGGRTKESNAKRKKKHKKSAAANLSNAEPVSADSTPGGIDSTPGGTDSAPGGIDSAPEVNADPTPPAPELDSKELAPILSHVVGISKEMSGHVVALTNKCELLLQEMFRTVHSLDDASLVASPSEARLVEFLLSHQEEEEEHTSDSNTLASKVENLRLVDSATTKGENEKSETKSIEPGRSEPKANDTTSNSHDALPTNPPAAPLDSDPTSCLNHSAHGSCQHRRKQSWQQCSLKVTENVMNSYQVSYSKLRLVNLFKNFTYE